jgi:acyl phosphate:glycerol-3-phosphate acyltransferase
MSMIFFIVLAYLIGSIPSGLLIARKKGIDIRQHGSGNIGATNIARVVGSKYGALTLAFDMVKGFIPVMLAKTFLPDHYIIQLVTGFAAVAGHTYSLFLNFKGGKGVATAGGVFLALLPGPTIASLLVFALVLLATKYVSLSSIMASITLPLAALLMGKPWVMVIFSVIVAALIVYKHKDNIARLREGKENKFKLNKGKA